MTTRRLSSLLIAILLTAGAGAAEPVSENATLVPTRKHSWIDEHEAQVAEARTIRPDVVFMGDSITNGWRNPGRKVWNERYAPLKAAGIAIPGDRIEHLLWRVQNGGLGDGIQPKVVVLMIGTNNARETAGQIAEGIKNLIGEVRARAPGARVLLLGILPRGETPNKWREKNDAANKLLAGMADGRTVWYLDFGDKFLLPGGVLDKPLMPDFLHPSAPGYAIWADAVDPVLRELLR